MQHREWPDETENDRVAHCATGSRAATRLLIYSLPLSACTSIVMKGKAVTISAGTGGKYASEILLQVATTSHYATQSAIDMEDALEPILIALIRTIDGDKVGACALPADPRLPTSALYPSRLNARRTCAWRSRHQTFRERRQQPFHKSFQRLDAVEPFFLHIDHHA